MLWLLLAPLLQALVPYPEERVYSQFGDLVELHTFRAGSGWNGAEWPASTTGSYDLTTWSYDEPSGLLLAKTDHLNRSVTYTYTNGLLRSRTWARGVAVTNTYNEFGDLARLAYTDGTPSVEFNDFNRAGQPRQIVDATGTNALTYDHASRLVATTNFAGGLLGSLSLTNHSDALYGRDWLGIRDQASGVTYQTAYAYDTYGRLGSVSSGNYSAAYGYLANSDLPSRGQTIAWFVISRGQTIAWFVIGLTCGCEPVQSQPCLANYESSSLVPFIMS